MLPVCVLCQICDVRCDTCPVAIYLRHLLQGYPAVKPASLGATLEVDFVILSNYITNYG